MTNINDLVDIDLGDIGTFDMPDIDISLLDFVPADEVEQTRYTNPKAVQQASEQVLYDNARDFARALKIDKGLRVDAFVSGNFIFGDFIEAFLTTHNCRAKKMTISTLSLNQNNLDSLADLMRNDYIGELSLVVSVYFWGNERNSLISYAYKMLDVDDRFQLAVADIHTKTVHFETEGAKKIVIHGSANLRSSGNIEQFTIEENPDLYDFYYEKFNLIVDKYATIRHSIRASQAWDCINNNDSK